MPHHQAHQGGLDAAAEIYASAAAGAAVRGSRHCPACHRRVCPLLGAAFGEGGVSGEIRGIPTEIHPGIVTATARLHQIVKRNAGCMTNSSVAGDPSQRVVARRVWRQGFEQIVAAIGVDFVEPNKQVRFAMRAGYIPRRQDLHATAAIPPNDLLCPRLNFAGDDGIGIDKLFGQVEIVGRLTLVIGKDEAIIALWAGPDQQPVKRSKDQVEVFQFFFARPQTARLYCGRLPSKV
jgi:hypothetical protein